MKTVFQWIARYKGTMYVSAAYGALASLLYPLGIVSGGDSPVGVWYWVYFSAWPLSHLLNIVVSALDGFIPDSIFALLYSSSPILAGMLQAYLISRCVFAVMARLRVSKQSSV